MTGMKIAKTLDLDDRGIHLVVDSDIRFLYLRKASSLSLLNLAHGLKLETVLLD